MGGWVVGASFHLGNEFSIDFSVGVGVLVKKYLRL